MSEEETNSNAYKPAKLRSPSTMVEPKTSLGRFLLYGHRLDEPSNLAPQPWYKVLWLTGVDYFSSLAYQPGIALIAAGAVAPIATIWLVGATLLGAVPIYMHVASRSFAGQGSIALLENVLEGWRGKLLVLVLLGFVCTGFLLTITISAADAAVHAVANPIFRQWLRDREFWVTLVFFVPLVVVFFAGFRKAIGWAMAVAIPYVFANALLLMQCLYEVFRRPEPLEAWSGELAVYSNISVMVAASVIAFPKLALGLSGFETSLSVMPQVLGGWKDLSENMPHGRILATRKLLLAAALLMSIALLTSSFVSAVLLAPGDWAPGGPAAGRVLSHLSHRLLGTAFGTIYDVLTLGILWFAAASAMVGLLNLIPRYLPRFGMAPNWAAYRRPLVVAVIFACVLITLLLGADVESQAPTYATAVLALILASGIAVAISLLRSHRESKDDRQRLSLFLRFVYFCFVSAVFTYAFFDIAIEDPRGLFGAIAIAAAILFAGAISRAWRSTELRVSDISFTDEQSAELWKSMVGKKVHVAPLRTSSREARRAKTEEIKKYYWADGALAFLHVDLVDNRSDFLAPLKISVKKEDDNFVVEVFGAVAIANTIAYISELIDPISLFLGLTQQNLMTQSIKYVLWGEGETGLMVYMILLRYWRWTTEEEDVRPNIFLMAA